MSNLVWFVNCEFERVILLFLFVSISFRSYIIVHIEWRRIRLWINVLLNHIIHFLFNPLHFIMMLCNHFIIVRSISGCNQQVFQKSRQEWKSCQESHYLCKTLKDWLQFYDSSWQSVLWNLKIKLDFERVIIYGITENKLFWINNE